MGTEILSDALAERNWLNDRVALSAQCLQVGQRVIAAFSPCDFMMRDQIVTGTAFRTTPTVAFKRPSPLTLPRLALESCASSEYAGFAIFPLPFVVAVHGAEASRQCSSAGYLEAVCAPFTHLYMTLTRVARAFLATVSGGVVTDSGRVNRKDLSAFFASSDRVRPGGMLGIALFRAIFLRPAVTTMCPTSKDLAAIWALSSGQGSVCFGTFARAIFGRGCSARLYGKLIRAIQTLLFDCRLFGWHGLRV